MEEVHWEDRVPGEKRKLGDEGVEELDLVEGVEEIQGQNTVNRVLIA